MSFYGAPGRPGPSAQDQSSSQAAVLIRHQHAWVSVGGLNGSCGKARAYCKPKKNVLLVEASFPDPEASAASQRVFLLFGDLFLSRNIIGDNVFDSNFHGGKKLPLE